MNDDPDGCEDGCSSWTVCLLDRLAALDRPGAARLGEHGGGGGKDRNGGEDGELSEHGGSAEAEYANDL